MPPKGVKSVAVLASCLSWSCLVISGLDYDISLTALCVAEDGKRTESDATPISTTTLPEKIRNLRLDNATANSLTIKWDTPVVSSNYKYKLNISGATTTGLKAWSTLLENKIKHVLFVLSQCIYCLSHNGMLRHR